MKTSKVYEVLKAIKERKDTEISKEDISYLRERKLISQMDAKRYSELEDKCTDINTLSKELKDMTEYVSSRTSVMKKNERVKGIETEIENKLGKILSSEEIEKIKQLGYHGVPRWQRACRDFEDFYLTLESHNEKQHMYSYTLWLLNRDEKKESAESLNLLVEEHSELTHKHDIDYWGLRKKAENINKRILRIQDIEKTLDNYTGFGEVYLAITFEGDEILREVKSFKTKLDILDLELEESLKKINEFKKAIQKEEEEMEKYAGHRRNEEDEFSRRRRKRSEEGSGLGLIGGVLLWNALS